MRKLFRPHPDISLVMLFKAIRTGGIKVVFRDTSTPKKVKENHPLQLGDRVVFDPRFLALIEQSNPIKKSLPSRTKDQPQRADFESWIVQEDDQRLIINKPAGISIHPSGVASDRSLSLYDCIKQYYSSRGFAGSMFQPNVAYRLDKDTS